ncbi:hypothetical protein PR003_g29157 [Phytophthora rubi]|uniref:N-acetyltransferase domain-containing protein n=1 Tax=Phytophthora rubi TaxID=129364 RepID=A0A6A3HEZ8_9STRA|nr:hypothetical protein PR002_g28044 [Phytophthora rubi]KAE8967952.1 hypothetical protein PR001_g27939 [Phytophthora rubi]KAE9276093.1 hypothetical protein PR003_g29157 [Phytophthora rubi]
MTAASRAASAAPPPATELELVVVTKKTKAEWLAQVVRLEKKSFSKSDSLGQRLVEEAMKPHNTLVLAVDGAVHGYILFRRNGTEAHIDRIAVAESQRRRGLGRRLLQFAVATLRTSRAAMLLLEADTANVGAIALYESQGFARATIRADYYKPGRDALLMELKL